VNGAQCPTETEREREREHDIGTMQTDSRNTLETIERYKISVFQVFIEDEL